MKGSPAKRTALKLALIPVAMFGFGYALVPLYNVFCDLTGLGGRGVKQVDASSVDARGVDRSRDIRVEFVTSVNGNLPWEFKALTGTTRIHPGALNEAEFVVENTSDKTIVGRAIYNVSPAVASVYFSKTECFCYTEQTLAPGEEMTMPVRYIIDTDLPGNIKGVTLSYTFFELSESGGKTAAAKTGVDGKQI
ncbi:MAG: cytochrome c oxidase assembly protein [Gammaproteobacteria bacterium]|nr:cytochrome c oxidase assembly protein [Gammaproteobacteria bacterium]